MHKHLFIRFLTAVSLLLGAGCIETQNTYSRLAPGVWRGVLTLEKTIYPVGKKDSVFILYDQFKEGELPFNFEVTYTDKEHFYLDIYNGTERIRCDSIRYGRDRTTARDTVNIYFPEYQSYLHADVRGGVMQGEWVVTTKEDYRIPFYAKAGQNYRFTALTQKPEGNLNGEWAALFGVETQEPDKAIGEFKQEGNRLTGTFRTETGDYRYLDGTVQGRKFWLSAFDGAHAFLISGSIQGDSLQGEFRSGKHFRTLWTGWRDPNFKLGHPDSLTSFQANAAISFALKTPEGEDLNFPSAAFEGKIKIFTISGTWCPNCRDEQVFLTEFLNKNPSLADKMSIVSFSFERNKDISQANAHLLEYKRQMGIPFDLVYAGKADRAEAQKMFPALSKVMAFPTLLILDKQNRIRRVHTGFDGPATSKYADFQQHFTELIQQLARE